MQKRWLPHLSWETGHFPFWEEGEERWLQHPIENSGLSIYEDQNNTHVEAAVPGMKSDEIKISFDRGMLWLKAQKKKRKKKKKNITARRRLSSRIKSPCQAILMKNSSLKLK
jgi:HSP20 family molecular chaperone IbpA